MGYTGGKKKNPTYRSLGDHSEALQIDYDPARISYEDLLKVFWASHNPCSGSFSRQYMTAVFYHDEAQKKSVVKTRARLAAEKGSRIVTEVLPAGRFYRAEDYHQKYKLRRNRSLMGEFKKIYRDGRGFVDSTAAARINGFLGGNGKAETLKKELELYGLSESSTRWLLGLADRLD